MFKHQAKYCSTLLFTNYSALFTDILLFPATLGFFSCSLICHLLVIRSLCCRYHFNVLDERLQQHVDKGRDDGLYISCVSSSLNMWALVMDAGTGFSSQVFELSPIFLHKVGIPEIPFYSFFCCL